MGSRFPSHQLGNGLYVSGRPEQPKEKPVTMGSSAMPYIGGDIKKSGELGKMFDIHMETSKTRKSGPITNAPLRTGSFGGAAAHSGPLMPNSAVRSSYPSGPLPGTAVPVSGGSSRHSSTSGPLNRHGHPVKKASGPQSGVAPMTRQNSGPLPPVLPATGLITSGPISSGPLNSSGAPRKVSGPFDSTGSTKLHSSSFAHNQAVTKLSEDGNYSFKRSFPKAILWTIILLFVMGFLAGGFIFGAVHNAILLIVVVVTFGVVAALFTWNSCWGRRAMMGFVSRYPDAELRTAKNGQYIKITGVVTCGNLPLESSFQKIPRCVYTSSSLYEYRGWDSKVANAHHRHFSWGVRSSERHVVDFYISFYICYPSLLTIHVNMVISLLTSPQLHYPPSASVVPSWRCRLNSSNFRCHQIPANSDVPTPPLSLDRRALLLGLGGLYTASAGSTLPASAHSPHDNTHTHTHSHFAKSEEQPIDYILPSSSAPKRVRRPAHLVDDTFVAKYEEGIRLMKQLPVDHPWNINNHADRHPLGVHNGWLFFPWHRLYLHFFERAIGRLIDDDTFALPYWNFDSPDGMTMPLLYTKNPNSPLHDPTRNPAHFPPAILDLRYAYMSGDSTALDPADQVQDNLWQIGMAFRQSLELGPLFSGGPMREGEPQYGGRIETLHMAVHQWAGEREFPYFNMGNPHTTPRDPMFYSLHANMDRLWDIYRGFRGNRDDYSDPEWLNIAFTFYDENSQLVRAKVRDALSSDKLGYTYEQVPLLWTGRLPMKPQTNITMGMSAIPASFTPVIGEFGHEPRTVDTSSSPVQVLVTRPKVRLSKSEEHELVEVLHIRGIDVIPGEPARFDVFVCSPYNNNVSSDGYGVFAGNFIKPHVVHPHDHMKTTNLAAEKPKEPKKKDIKGGLKLGLAPVLEAIDAEGEEKLVVTIVPRDGKVVLDGVGVELLQSDGSLLI